MPRATTATKQMPFPAQSRLATVAAFTRIHPSRSGRTPGALLTLLLALLSGACAKQHSELRIGVQGNTDLLRPVLTVRATAPGWSRVWQGMSIGTPDSPNLSPAVRAPAHGTLRVTADLHDDAGEMLTTGYVELDLSPDWSWEVDVFLWNENPTDGCVGCIGYHAYPVPDALRTTPTDSLYLVWGGNHIKVAGIL